jgi:hypothetical protein
MPPVLYLDGNEVNLGEIDRLIRRQRKILRKEVPAGVATAQNGGEKKRAGISDPTRKGGENDGVRGV